MYEVSNNSIRCFELHSGQLGIPHAHLGELRGGDKEHNALLLTGVLNGSVRGPKRDVVVLNAAAGFVVTGIVSDLKAGLELAREQLDSGKALAKLQELQEFSVRSWE